MEPKRVEIEEICVIRVYRELYSSEYSAVTSFPCVAKVADEHKTIEGLFAVVAEQVRTELRQRDTMPALPLPSEEKP